MDRLPDWVWGAVSRICIFLMPSNSTGCFSPSPPLLSHAAHPQCSGWGEIEVVLFCSVWHSWGSQVLTCMLSLSSGEISSREGLSWHSAVWSWGRGDGKKMKLVPLTIFNASNPPPFFFFFFGLWWCTGTSLLDSWTPKTTLSPVGDCQNLEGRW